MATKRDEHYLHEIEMESQKMSASFQDQIRKMKAEAWKQGFNTAMNVLGDIVRDEDADDRNPYERLPK